MDSKKSDGGVNYELLDPVKRLGQEFGAQTLHNLEYYNVTLFGDRMGESAPLLKFPDGGIISTVLEGLGTKSAMAEFVYQQTGDLSGHKAISQCCVAMIVNDIITSGVLPVTVQMYFAVGRSEWFNDINRAKAILEGWRDACNESFAAWIGGETPALRRIIESGSADFAGSAIGFLSKQYQPFGDELQAGDHIIGFESTGVHANGMTGIQDSAEQKLNVEEKICLYKKCLIPTRLYVDLIKSMHERNIRPTRVENITGHGFRKFMRSKKPFTYRITDTQAPQPVFKRIQTLCGLTDEQMYSSYNMGTGFIAFVREDTVNRMLDCGTTAGYNCKVLGVVEKSDDDKKRVIIEPFNIIFEEDSMSLR